jgi:hypothetical protein
MALCTLAAWAAFGEAVAPPSGVVSHPTRQQLIGAWRLVRIEVSGPGGPLRDPFYQPDSVGLIIYDPSGWMSVQIAAPQRPAGDVPATRSGLAGPAAAAAAQAKAAAFDTYYAYFGTWTLDEASSVVTHRVSSSLIPAEIGRAYAQTITLEGTRLTFSGPDVIGGRQALRRKIWERIDAGAPPRLKDAGRGAEEKSR